MLTDECNNERIILSELLLIPTTENTPCGKVLFVSKTNSSPLKGRLVGLWLDGLLVGWVEGCALGSVEGWLLGQPNGCVDG